MSIPQREYFTLCHSVHHLISRFVNIYIPLIFISASLLFPLFWGSLTAWKIFSHYERRSTLDAWRAGSKRWLIHSPISMLASPFPLISVGVSFAVHIKSILFGSLFCSNESFAFHGMKNEELNEWFSVYPSIFCWTLLYVLLTHSSICST